LMLSFNESLYFGLNPLTNAGSWSQWPVSMALKAQLVLDLDSDGLDDVMFSDDTTYVLLNRH
jgi:hypothetical protein